MYMNINEKTKYVRDRFDLNMNRMEKYHPNFVVECLARLTNLVYYYKILDGFDVKETNCSTYGTGYIFFVKSISEDIAQYTVLFDEFMNRPQNTNSGVDPEDKLESLEWEILHALEDYKKKEEIEKLRRSGLSKLTQEERQALGL